MRQYRVQLDIPPRPFFSLVLHYRRNETQDLPKVIRTISDQSFGGWELILVNTEDGAQPTDDFPMLSNRDPRIRTLSVKRAGLVPALNAAIGASQGNWIIPLDVFARLRPNALTTLHQLAQESSSTGLIYVDEGRIDNHGRKTRSDQKPSWSPERLRHHMYLGHFLAFRRDLVMSVGMYRENLAGSHDYDLALRISENTNGITHVPIVLYDRFITDGPISEIASTHSGDEAASHVAVREHLERLGLGDYKVSESRVPGTYSLERPFNSDIRVSVVIPTRGGSAQIWGQSRTLVTHTVSSLLEHTSHRNLEIIIVFDSDTPETVLKELRELGGSDLTLVRYSRPFNFSEKCNLGFAASNGEMVVFLNDDMEITSDHFVESLCAPLSESGVGATGARLIFENGTIQHAGVITERGNFMHAYAKWADNSVGYCNDLLIDHEVSMVTGACLATRRDTFKQVGGFDEELPSNFNDVDLCFKIRGLGLRIIWLSEVRAFHFESLTRDNTVTRQEVQLMANRWPRTSTDPYMPQESHRLIRNVRLTTIPRKLLSLYRRTRRQLRRKTSQTP